MRLHTTTEVAEDAACREALAFSEPGGTAQPSAAQRRLYVPRAAMQRRLMAAGADSALVAARAPAAAAAAAKTRFPVLLATRTSPCAGSRKKTGGGGGGGARRPRPALEAAKTQTDGADADTGTPWFLQAQADRGGKKVVVVVVVVLASRPRRSPTLSGWLGGRSGDIGGGALLRQATVVSSPLQRPSRLRRAGVRMQRSRMRASRLMRPSTPRSTGRARPTPCALLDERTALRVQRLAMTVSDFSLLTVRQALFRRVAAAACSPSPPPPPRSSRRRKDGEGAAAAVRGSAPGGGWRCVEAEQMGRSAGEY